MASPDSIAARLEHRLDHLHALLRAGDLAGIAPAAADLEADLTAFERAWGDLSAADLDRLRRKSERNAACLQGAARGIRAARRRITEVRMAATGLAAYDAQGQRVGGGEGASLLARRF